MDDFIIPNYETINTAQKRYLVALYSSSIINAFSYQDYLDAINIMKRVLDRLEMQNNGLD